MNEDKGIIIDQEQTPNRSIISLPEIRGNGDEIVKAIEERAVIVKRMKIALIAICNHGDFEKMGDSYYLRETGANKIAPHMGVETHIDSITRNDLGDGDYQYVVTGWAQCHGLGGERVSITGQAKATRPFYKGQWLRGTLDPGHIINAAVTNFTVRAISRVTGLQNITEEEMRRSRIDTSMIGEVEYDTSESQAKAHAKQYIQGDLSKIEEYADLLKYGVDGSNNESEALVRIESIDCKTGETKGKQWTRTAVEINGEQGPASMGTFDNKIGGVLLNAYRHRCNVVIWFEKPGKYYNIIGAEIPELPDSETRMT